GTLRSETHAPSPWCCHACERAALAAAMAATNYAIEGVTGDWSALVCSKNTYESGFDPAVRAKAMKWLKLHAKYDDTHPWEALEIICSIMGNNVTRRGATLLRAGIVKSYEYMRLTLDRCMRTGVEETRPAPLISLAYPEER